MSFKLNPLTGNIDRMGAFSTKVMFTPEGGLAIRILNKTGAPSVKGSVVSASGSTDEAFALQTNEFDAIGVVYEAGVADASLCWVVVSGIADVLLKDTTASTHAHVVFSADTDGRAITGAVPTPPNADSHFKEIGHCIQSKNAGINVLARCVLHFN
jgi:hypothetical protein